MTTETRYSEPNMDRTEFAIKYNNCTVHEPCAICGEDIHPGVGPQLFKKDTWASVCLGCGRKYAPELVEALIKYWNLSEYDTWNPKKQAESDAAHHRQDTCLDEQKIAELWAKSEPRYYVDLVTTRYPGYKEVSFDLFHTEMTDEEICQLVVFAKDRTIDDLTYPRSHVEETFSKAEVRQLYDYFATHYEGDRLKVKRAGPPSNDCMGYGAYPVGGGTDFYEFDRVEGYSLPFKISGYLDLRHCEAHSRESSIELYTTGRVDPNGPVSLAMKCTATDYRIPPPPLRYGYLSGGIGYGIRGWYTGIVYRRCIDYYDNG